MMQMNEALTKTGTFVSTRSCSTHFYGHNQTTCVELAVAEGLRFSDPPP